MEFSIIIATFNEAENIGFLIDKIKAMLIISDYDYEIIVVDAGSTDDTCRISKEKRVRVLIQKHPGYGGALYDAIKSANGKYM